MMNKHLFDRWISAEEIGGWICVSTFSNEPVLQFAAMNEDGSIDLESACDVADFDPEMVEIANQIFGTDFKVNV